MNELNSTEVKSTSRNVSCS